MCNAHSRSAIRHRLALLALAAVAAMLAVLLLAGGAPRPGSSIAAGPKAVPASTREVAGGSALDHDPALR